MGYYQISTPTSIIAFQALLHKKYIKIGSITFYKHAVIKLWSQFFQRNMKKCEYMQIIHAIPRSRKEDFNDLFKNINNFIIQSHHLVKRQQNCCVNRLNSKEIYDIFM